MSVAAQASTWVASRQHWIEPQHRIDPFQLLAGASAGTASAVIGGGVGVGVGYGDGALLRGSNIATTSALLRGSNIVAGDDSKDIRFGIDVIGVGNTRPHQRGDEERATHDGTGSCNKAGMRVVWKVK